MIDAPQKEVFSFFSRAENLEILTPPWLKFRILTPLPISMQRHVIIEYSIKLYGLRMRWRTDITDWDPPRFFQDSQLRGPYELWEHRHYFEEKDGKTLMTDIVDYVPPGGPFSNLINSLFVKKNLDKIFDYRAERIILEFPRSD